MSENSIPSRIEYSKEVWQEYMSVLANSTKSNNNKLNSSTCSVISLNKLNHVSDGNSTSSKVKDVDSNSNYSLTDSLSDIEMNDNISEQNENNNLNRFDNSTEEISIRNMQISIDHTTTNHDNCHKISKSHESNNGNKQTKTDNYNRFETTHSHDYKNPRKENPKPYEFEELSTGKVTRTLGRKGSLEQTSSSEQNNYSEKNKKMKQISSHEQNNYSEMIKRIKQIIPCLKGLQNHGNTCYFNALMQCLANCESFAQFLLCNNFVFSNENYLFYLFVHTIRCIWFNHPNVDYYCGKTVKCIGKMNSDFVFGSQHDSHECMIWLLNKIQNEVVIEVENKIDYYLSDNSDIRNHGVGTSHMSIDHLPSLKHKRDEDSILNLFRCTLRHEIKCMNRNCDFIQTSLEPCLSVSLSVPSPRKININFIFNNPKRDGYRFSCEIFDNSLTIKDLKYQIMNEVKNVSLKNMIAYLFKPDGESMFLKDDLPINKSLTELTIFEIPEQSDLPNNYIRSIVIFVIGDFPNSKMIGMPFVASLKNNLNYKELGFELLKEGKFLLPDSYYKMTQNFKINLQTSDNSGIMDNEINKDKPLCLDVLPESEYGNILRIIVEWDLSLKYEFENIRFNFINRNKSFNNHFDLKPIQLINLIDNFVKTEPIENWECDKCGKESGYIRICFESMPDILVFYLKRFATSNHTIKNDRNVAIPFEGLNLDKYVHKSNNNIYNLTSVIYHHGGTIKFGNFLFNQKIDF